MSFTILKSGFLADEWCSGLWLVASGLMIVAFGKEILQGLAIAGSSPHKVNSSSNAEKQL